MISGVLPSIGFFLPILLVPVEIERCLDGSIIYRDRTQLDTHCSPKHVISGSRMSIKMYLNYLIILIITDGILII